MSSRTRLPGSKPVCTSESLTFSPMSSMSKATCERRSWVTAATVSSSKPTASTNSGVNVWKV